MLAATTAEVPLDGLQLPKHFQRFQRALNQRDGIGVAAARWSERCARDDRAGVDRLDIVALERGQRRHEDVARIAEAGVAAIRAETDRVELQGRCIAHAPAPIAAR